MPVVMSLSLSATAIAWSGFTLSARGSGKRPKPMTDRRIAWRI
jgi:hypothetical protein